MNPVALASAALVAQPGDFSLISLFFQADIVVKIVMIGLIGASVWCWAIIFEKTFSLGPCAPADQPVREDLLVRPVAG